MQDQAHIYQESFSVPHHRKVIELYRAGVGNLHGPATLTRDILRVINAVPGEGGKAPSLLIIMTITIR